VLALLIGASELEREVVTLRQMETSEQTEVPVSEALPEVLRRLGRA
jgi:histidyl-tRNA synthetase